MKPLLMISPICLLVFLSACQKETTVESPEEPTAGSTPVFVQGAWLGTLEDQPFDVTFIEGEFEGDPTVSGSAHVTEQTQSVFYAVGGGTHNRKDSVWFGLFKVPNLTGEGYVLKGAVRGATLTGTYRQADQNNVTIRTGTWEVKRSP